MSMLIVSNDQNIDSAYTRGNKLISYDDFLVQAYSDDGLDLGSNIIINVNEIAQGVFEELRGVEEIKYFTLEETVPDFLTDEELEDIKVWISEEKQNEEIEEDFEIQMKGSSKVEERVVKTQQVGNTGESRYSEVIDLGQLDQGDVNSEISKLLANNVDLIEQEAHGKDIYNNKEAKVFLFGSSKGGSGKTFTTLISARRYAKTHPDQNVAVLDFDIIDGQVGISIHKMAPTMFNYYKEYQKGYSDHRTMKEFCVQGNNKMPSNLDFYLAPNNGRIIRNDDFWLNILNNLVHNYDALFIDTGIDYLNVHPISYAYKVADKVCITTTTSIKSVNSITKMIKKLTGNTPNPVFSKEDGIEPKLNIVITQMIAEDEMNATAYSNLEDLANVVATFGVITRSVSQAEYFGYWDIFDNNDGINNTLDKILDL